mmetsp:Transcript_26191/g.104772  ORF Transcript_26191/g.104772 Transcript_26191/m.104772 type:complete len:507 (+) Transcript_26191:150-1670(+)
MKLLKKARADDDDDAAGVDPSTPTLGAPAAKEAHARWSRRGLRRWRSFVNASRPRLSLSRDALRKNWLLAAICCAIPLARRAPWVGRRGGPLRPELTVKYGAVGAIFLLSGASLKPRHLVGAVGNARLHGLVQGLTLGCAPALSYVVAVPALKALGAGALGASPAAVVPRNPWLLQGLQAVSCLPPPVSSAVILTKAAGGNEAAAIFNSAVGSLLGVVVTPALLVATVAAPPDDVGLRVLRHREGAVRADPPSAADQSALPSSSTIERTRRRTLSAASITPLVAKRDGPETTTTSSTLRVLADVVRQLATTILLPLCAGQAARRRWRGVEAFVDRRKPELAHVGQATLVLIVYTTFCDAFASARSSSHAGDLGVSAGDLAKTAGLVVAAQLAASALVFVAARRWCGFAPGDVVCAVFCATHKSLTLGVPVMNVVFGTHPAKSLLAAPLLIYHPTQILLGGLLVPLLRTWLADASSLAVGSSLPLKTTTNGGLGGPAKNGHGHVVVV